MSFSISFAEPVAHAFFPSSAQDPRWFAVAVKPRHEKAVAGALEQKGYPAWLPLFERVHSYQSRRRKFQIPLFPGYVFCCMQPLARLPVLTTPGVLRIVGAGRTPMPIDEAELQSVRRAVERRAVLRPAFPMESGHKVRIAEGPFAGISGVVVRMRNPFRLLLSITLLQRAVALEIESDQVAIERV
jgi:transcription antitermination factor NusG